MPNVETAIREVKLGTDDYLVFKSGAQVNKKLIDDYVVQIPSLNEPKVSIEDFVSQQKKHKQVEHDVVNDFKNTGMEHVQDEKDVNNMGNAEIIPHPDDTQAMIQWEMKHNKPQEQDSPTRKPAPKAKDPLLDLLEKSKKEKVSLNVDLELEMPSSLFLKILVDSYDDKKDIILGFILGIIKDGTLDEEIKKFIEKYIGDEPKQKR